MPLPTLHHKIPVFIRKSEREETARYDDNLHEPIGQIQRSQKPIKIYGQHQNADVNKAVATEGLVSESSGGYFLFRTKDLKDKNLTIERGDQIVQIGEGRYEQLVDYYIISLEYCGHYPKFRGPTLVKAKYRDRNPTR